MVLRSEDGTETKLEMTNSSVEWLGWHRQHCVSIKLFFRGFRDVTKIPYFPDEKTKLASLNDLPVHSPPDFKVVEECILSVVLIWPKFFSIMVLAEIYLVPEVISLMTLLRTSCSDCRKCIHVILLNTSDILKRHQENVPERHTLD